MAVERGKDGTGTSGRQPRKRRRGLLTQLQEQVEFYFGDANLPKDKFLQQQMKDNDGFVPVKLIANFNRMKKLTSDFSLILQAIKNSSLVELSGDQQKLRRCVPLPEIAQSDVDVRTIYVENLPTTVDHKYIQSLFGAFGNVVYVSLPRHKISEEFKGFAFIEFSTSDEAQAALEYFRSGTKPPPTPVTKKSLQSALAAMDTSLTEEVPKGREDERKKERGEEKEEEEGAKDGERKKGEEEEMEASMNEEELRKGNVEEGEEVGKEPEKNEESKEGEREEQGEDMKTEKKEDEERDREDQGQVETLRSKEDTGDGVADRKEGGEGGEGKGIKLEVKGSRKRTRSDSGGEGEDREEGEREEEEADQSRPRKSARLDSGEGKKKEDESRKAALETSGRGEEECGDTKPPPLDIQKPEGQRRETDSQEEEEEGRERKAARLDSQSSEFFREKRKKKNRQHKKRDKWAAFKGTNFRVMAKTEWLEMKGLYRQMQKEQMRQLKSLSQSAQDECADGEKEAITAEGLKKDGEPVKILKKETCSKFGEVAYVDFSDGDKEGYVRYRTAGCVEKAVESASTPAVKLSAVSEEDERAYFLRTQANRKQARKLKQNKSHKGQRGREKVVSKALQRYNVHGGGGGGEGRDGRGGGGGGSAKGPEHIRFADSDEDT